MFKLSAYITTAYLSYTSLALAAGDNHGSPAAHVDAEGALIEGAMAAAESGVHAEAHAEKGGLPQFEPDWFASQIFWLIIAFAALYLIFAKKTLPEISSVIENRKDHIQSNLESAEKLTAEADTVHDEYVAGLQNSQAKAVEEIQKAESTMKEKSATAMENFRGRSESELQAAENRIMAAKDAAMGDMNAIATDAAHVAVKKIIGSSDASKVKAIVEGMNGKAKAA